MYGLCYRISKSQKRGIISKTNWFLPSRPQAHLFNISLLIVSSRTLFLHTIPFQNCGYHLLKSFGILITNLLPDLRVDCKSYLMTYA